MSRQLSILALGLMVAAFSICAIGCGNSSNKPSQLAGQADADRTAARKTPADELPGSTNPLFHFPFPLPSGNSPSGTSVGSDPTSAAVVNPSTFQQTNTRPVGPFGVRQITLGLNDLRQTGALLLAFYNENNAWPRNEIELQGALREMPHVYKAIQVGDYIFVPAKNPNLLPGALTAIIYEKLPDKSGTRLVLFGDGSVKRLSVVEFNQLKLPTQ